jgi:hypothetical protein
MDMTTIVARYSAMTLVHKPDPHVTAPADREPAGPRLRFEGVR